MELTKKLYNKTAKFIQNEALNNKQEVYINFFGEEEEHPSIATLEINFPKYVKHIKLNEQQAKDILDKTIRKLLGLRVKYERSFGEEDHRSIDMQIISGYLQGLNDKGLPETITIDYRKGLEHEIWNEADDYFIYG